jgi:hypothetical protein
MSVCSREAALTDTPRAFVSCLPHPSPHPPPNKHTPQVVIPRPGKTADSDPPGVGLVFLEYADAEGARRACEGLNGRTIGDNTVEATLVGTTDGGEWSP